LSVSLTAKENIDRGILPQQTRQIYMYALFFKRELSEAAVHKGVFLGLYDAKNHHDDVMF
jgi:hypothetical protein